jgi:hypothetical protein
MADSQSYRIRATPGVIAQYKARGLTSPVAAASTIDASGAVNLKVTRDELLELIKDASEQRDLNRGSIKRVYSYFLEHLRWVQRKAAEVKVNEPRHYSRYGHDSAPVCGLPQTAVQAWEAAGREGELRIEPVTTNIKNVTCQACRKEIASIVEQWATP